MSAKSPVGETIRKTRQERGLSQMELAQAANLTQSYVGGVERGDRNASVDVINRIAKALGVPAGELLSPEEFRLHRDVNELFADIPASQRAQILQAVREVVRVLRQALRGPDKRTTAR